MLGRVYIKKKIDKYNMDINNECVTCIASTVCPQILLKGQTREGNFGETARMLQYWRSCLPAGLLGSIFFKICAGD